MTDFGSELRRHRLRSGWTQATLASRAELSVQAISALERGTRRFPHQTTVRLLADALGLSDEDGAAFVASARRPVPRDSGRATPLRPAQTARQLPPAVADITGRRAEIAELCQSLRSAAARSPAVAVAAIAGMGGVGKTTIAVHAAHTVAGEFPDGQLYLNLRGFGPDEPMQPADALRILLAALDVPVEELGSGVDELAAHLRSRLAGKRILLLLDNAVSVDQVTPLLPGAAGCAAIVTSRRLLNVLTGAHHLAIDVLAEDDATELLARIAGHERIALELEAARRLVDCAGRLPLALRIAGARLRARPRWPVSHLVRLLDDERRRLDELTTPDLGVRTCLAPSLDQLSLGDSVAAQMFDALGILNSGEFGTAVAARLVETSDARAERILERLVDSCLLETPAPGRYIIHDLIRAYARERSLKIPDQHRSAALTRALTLFTSAARSAHANFFAESARMLLIDDRSRPGSGTVDVEKAWTLLDAETSTCEQLVRQCDGWSGIPSDVLIAFGLAQYSYCRARHRWRYWQRASQLALEAACASGDRIAEAVLRRDLGWALHEIGDHLTAIHELDCSRSILHDLGERWWEAWACCNLSHVYEAVGRHDQAISSAKHSLAISEAIGDSERIASALICLGNVYASAGDATGQHAAHQQSLAIYQELGQHPMLAQALFEVGIAYRRTGRHGRAVELLERSVTIRQAQQHSRDAVKGLAELGTVHLLRGSSGDARRSYQRALAILASSSDPDLEADIRRRLGDLSTSSAGGKIRSRPVRPSTRQRPDDRESESGAGQSAAG